MTTTAPCPPPTTPMEIVLPVEGMTCATCVNRIERFLARADGVEGATVNLASEQASVRYDPARIDRAGIVAAIEAAGYDVRTDPTAGRGDPPSAGPATSRSWPAPRSGAGCSGTAWPPSPSVWS